MPDFFTEGGLKYTTAALIKNTTGQFWMVRRTTQTREGLGMNNAGKIAFPGSDGDALAMLVAQTQERLALHTVDADWTRLGVADNPAQREFKVVFAYTRAVDALPDFSPNGHDKGKYADVFVMSADEIRQTHINGQLSPAAFAVMRRFPDIF